MSRRGLMVSAAVVIAALMSIGQRVETQGSRGGFPIREINASSDEGNAVYAESNNVGVFAGNRSSAYKAYLATRCCAGDFYGPVYVHGYLKVDGAKNFVIDSPLDPANTYLNHASVESPELKNMYDGVSTLNARGEAVVDLPRWFGALNADFRYQLTPIGGAAPALHIAREIADNRFTIAGGPPGLKVSWLVTGVRQDAWAKANPLIVEEPKPAAERGTFLHPEVLGQPRDKQVEYARHVRAR